ncbi:Eco47II family restriction endonuclease [Bernardetia sp.]|uniref:Eco47II family restriction endonuclease n=1 Tax=Bernardetia sp. TaxID=1937974 RepID=UPI0025BE94B5|nr:Eco47II family restriction endonuclease [Bernardetia sp.]
MANKYLSYISDEHLLNCIGNLHTAYLAAKNNISKKKFYSQKIDTIKLTFDSKFNEMDEETLIKAEIARQIDKSINNAIGTFHEEILGGINGYQRGNSSGYDIKATDDSLFADIKNKHNTMNSSSAESLYQKLQKFADVYPNSKCYWVQIWAKGSFNQRWFGKINGSNYNHDRVYKISGDKFYALLTGKQNALFELYKVLPKAIEDYLQSIEKSSKKTQNSAFDEIKKSSQESGRSILDEITFENFGYYLGFDKL